MSDKKLPLKVKTNWPEYEPGETVELDVSMTQPDNFEADEQFFASITVTDTSSLLQVSKHKLMPSLPAMTYLEKEIKQLDGSIDEFIHSADYIDSLFDVNSDEEVDFEKLDVLLGT